MVQVPLAHSLALCGAAPILGAELESRGLSLEYFKYLGKGQEALVIGNERDAIRIVAGEGRDRQRNANLLQAESRGSILTPCGQRFSFEILERTMPVDELEFDTFSARLSLDGAQYSDLAKNNIGRSRTGLILAIDPGGSFDTPIELFANRVLVSGRLDADNPPIFDQIVAHARAEGFSSQRVMTPADFLRFLGSIIEARPELASSIARQRELLRA
jgi:hypothetical protein